MAVEQGFRVNRRVNIAIDALSAGQKAALEPVLRTKQSFVAHATRRGATEPLSATKPLFSMRVGAGGLRVIFTRDGDDIVVQDIMQKATVDHFAPRRPDRDTTTKKGAGGPRAKAGRATKLHES
jgi:hypothetical protein